MGGTKGYRSYRGRGSKGKAALAAVLVLVVVGNFVTVPEGAAGAVLGFITSPIVLVVAAGVAGLCVRAAKGGLRK